jgi:hypothetical protein
MITNGASCTCEIKSKSVMAKAAFDKEKTLFTSKLGLNLRTNLAKCYLWSTALYNAESWTLWKVHQKYLESSKMQCHGRSVGTII